MTLKKIDHEFKHPQLSYDATPNIQPCIKLSFWFNKLPHVSDEQFHRHWETVHADLTIAAKDFGACKIQRYVQVWAGNAIDKPVLASSCDYGSFTPLGRLTGWRQFHQTAEMKERAKSLGLEHLDFDGCSEIWVKSWDDWVSFYSSPEYAAALSPDCQHFMAMPIHVAVGYENLVFGEALPGMGGKNGVTRASEQQVSKL